MIPLAIKYECRYMQSFEGGKALRHRLGAYFDWYSKERPHQGLDDQAPDEVYLDYPTGNRRPDA